MLRICAAALNSRTARTQSLTNEKSVREVDHDVCPSCRVAVAACDTRGIPRRHLGAPVVFFPTMLNTLTRLRVVEREVTAEDGFVPRTFRVFSCCSKLPSLWVERFSSNQLLLSQLYDMHCCCPMSFAQNTCHTNPTPTKNDIDRSCRIIRIRNLSAPKKITRP